MTHLEAGSPQARAATHRPSFSFAGCAPRGVAAAAIAAAVLLWSCAPQPAAQRCRRVDLLPSGEGLVFAGPDGAGSVFDAPGEAIDVAVTAARSPDAPLVLVHSAGGVENRFELRMPPSSTPAHRCRIGADAASSTCSASATGPLAAGGSWKVEPGSDRVLEAGLALKLCD